MPTTYGTPHNPCMPQGRKRSLSHEFHDYSFRRDGCAAHISGGDNARVGPWELTCVISRPTCALAGKATGGGC
ncbi:hypothetical protein Hypma_000837 [Hypsizygus marmoreus]|uniref:Uncharacterized protein n=1 Tax=Hypsizygus marmoreus TaxID=39966 RepID=A0A369JC47_HYPMA|nr:hypothetical protein Hypma_004546 [Hypsizygus marmoreus]RDB17995.1 hypothetical protein Hypma_000837 [Hypsizygus marmoreus]